MGYSRLAQGRLTDVLKVVVLKLLEGSTLHYTLYKALSGSLHMNLSIENIAHTEFSQIYVFEDSTYL